MAETVFEIIQSNNPHLAETLNTNEDVSKFLMSAYAHILQLCQRGNFEVKDVKISIDIVRERLLKIVVTVPGKSGNTTNVGDILPRQRNLNLTKLLQVNRSIRDLALNVVYTLETWTAKTPWIVKEKAGFKDIKTFNATLWRGDPPTITAELIITKQFDEYVSHEMGWDKQEEAEEAEKKITKGSDLIQ